MLGDLGLHGHFLAARRIFMDDPGLTGLFKHFLTDTKAEVYQKACTGTVCLFVFTWEYVDTWIHDWHVDERTSGCGDVVHVLLCGTVLGACVLMYVRAHTCKPICGSVCESMRGHMCMCRSRKGICVRVCRGCLWISLRDETRKPVGPWEQNHGDMRKYLKCLHM